MNVLNSFVLGAATLAAILAIISICLPTHIHIQRHVIVEAPVEDTFEQIQDLRNWTKLFPWHLEDPDMELTFSGPAGGEGAQYSWRSQHANPKAGVVTIVEVEPNKRLVTNVAFQQDDTANGTFTLEETAEGTKVTWYLDKYMGSHPIDKFSGLLVNSTVGEDFEKGLENLKKKVESRRKSLTRVSN
ncbi:SRPBCC family protein [Pontibacter roseus]|uniref:SRPBCC family protein n=1 Tax=Pontibacter roseus TaxID=336989 RepID=UPI00035E150F|nr:SRPBCC family protein [Pontibacter roseus]